MDERHERRVQREIVPAVVEIGRDHQRASLAGRTLEKRGIAGREPRQRLARGSADARGVVKRHQPEARRVCRERLENGVAAVGRRQHARRRPCRLDRDDAQRRSGSQDIANDVTVDLRAGRDQHAAPVLRVRREEFTSVPFEAARREQQHRGVRGEAIGGPSRQLGGAGARDQEHAVRRRSRQRMLHVERVAFELAGSGNDQDRRFPRAAEHGIAHVVGLDAAGILDRHRRGRAARRAGERRIRRLVRSTRSHHRPDGCRASGARARRAAARRRCESWRRCDRQAAGRPSPRGSPAARPRPPPESSSPPAPRRGRRRPTRFPAGR